MKTAAVSELKSLLSKYLSQVKAGEEVMITDRGKPIAKLIPISRADTDVSAHLLALERAGPELTTEGLVKAMEGINDYTDIFGYRVSFAADKHSGATESVLSQVQDGRWVKLEQAITY